MLSFAIPGWEQGLLRGKAHCYAEVEPFKPQVDAGWMCCHESCMLGLHNSLEVFMYELSQG